MAEGAVIVGTVLTIKGDLDAAQAQAAQTRKEAGIRRSQIQELLRRGELSLKNITAEGEQFVAKQEAAFVAGGVDISSKTSLLVLEETQSRISEQFMQTQREIAFSASIIEQGALSLEEASRRIERAAGLQATGTAISGVGQLFLDSGG